MKKQETVRQITINNVEFTLDLKYQLLMDLVSKKYEQQSLIIDH